MLDDVISETVEVIWGFAVPTLPNGRRQWPTGLRDMVLQKVVAGAGVRKTAEESGANQSLVHHWVKRARCVEEPLTFIEDYSASEEKSKNSINVHAGSSRSVGWRCLTFVGKYIDCLRLGGGNGEGYSREGPRAGGFSITV